MEDSRDRHQSEETPASQEAAAGKAAESNGAGPSGEAETRTLASGVGGRSVSGAVARRDAASSGGGPGGSPIEDSRQESARSPEGDLVGTVLDNRYRILRLVGEGGMGHVYEAEHVGLGRRVAVKVLHKIFSADLEVLERFRREARAASAVGHPNIVDVTDTGTTPDGRAFFVMEYLEGVELADVIIGEGKLEEERAVHIAIQICDGVAAAHRAGVIHRDLKPENVFLVFKEGEPDFVKILDFGIAKTASLEKVRGGGLTQPGFAMGTPEYMAPEQAAGLPVDERADVYAIGGVLYAMLAGRPPHQGANVMDVLKKKVTLPVEPLSKYRPGVSKQLERVVMWALEKEPEDRPASAEILAYELRKFLRGRPSAVAAVLGLSEAGTGGLSEPERKSASQELPIAYADAAEPLPWEVMDATEPQEVADPLALPSLPTPEPRGSEPADEPAQGPVVEGVTAEASAHGGTAASRLAASDAWPVLEPSVRPVVRSRPLAGLGWVAGFLVLAGVGAGAAFFLWWGAEREDGRSESAPIRGTDAGSVDVGGRLPGMPRSVVRPGPRARSRPRSRPRHPVTSRPVDLDRAVRRVWSLARRGRWTGPGEENVLHELKLLEGRRQGAVRKLRRYAARVLTRRAKRALRRRRLEEAERAYRDLLAVVPGERRTKRALAEVLVARARALLERDPAQAAALAGEAVVLSDGWSGARYVWARALERAGSRQQALLEYEKLAGCRRCPRRYRRAAARAMRRLRDDAAARAARPVRRVTSRP